MNHSRSRFSSVAWKVVASLVCFTLVFSPIANVWDVSSIRIARAAEPGSGGVADTPTPVPCGAGVWCTDAQQAKEIDKVKSRIDYQLMFPLYLGFLNAVTMMAQQLAYDTAEWVASGGKGKMPLIEVFKFGDYTKQIGLDAAGEFIGTVSEKFTEGAFGINLCRPPRFQGIALQFALRLPTYYLTGINRPKPKCDWTTIVSNWEASKDSLSQQDVIKNVSGSFTTGGNDVSFGLGLNVGFLDLMAERREAAILDRLEGKGFKSVQSLISGNIKTPAAVVEQDINEQIIRQPNASKNIETSALLGNAFELGWMQVGTVALSTFANVLVSRLLGKITKGLFDTSGAKGLTIPDFANSDAAPLSASGARSEQIVSEQYRDILTPKIATSEAQDLLGELLGCPDAGRTKWNCAMDQSLEAVLRQGGMTVRQAIEGGYINAQFRLIPSTQLKDNLDSGCAQRAFCVSNLRKLRLARIIPIGWEMAADSPRNQQLCSGGAGCITLAEVIDNFDNCNDEGLLDDEHPWCHLIDPNWVLTSFQAQCLTKGYGNSFITGTNQRMQECQDTVTCLEKDTNGKCQKGYGYCLAEQTYYQFDSLTCKEQYVSCRTYTPRGGNAKPIGYLRSTLDYGTCDESNVGCMWFSAKRNPSFREGNKTVAEWSSLPADRIYLNKNIESCDASGDGCSDLRRVVRAQPSLNMIRNSSFEDVDDSTKALQYWVFDSASYTYDSTPITYSIPEVDTGLSSFDGSSSYLVTGPAQQVVSLQPGRQYTLSFYARAFSSSPTNAGASVTFYTNRTSGDPRMPPSGIDTAATISDTTFFKSPDCAITNVPAGGTSNQALILLPSLATDWQRVQCSFVAPPTTAWGRVRLIPGNASWLVDGVKLEESEVATAYNEGVNPNLTPAYIKVPPQELGCTGDAAVDNPLCANFARVCRAYEAGCQGYTPKNQLAAPEVPAVLSDADLCPAQCVGYAQFRKLASTFDLVHNADIPMFDDPDDQSIAAFIPSTAKSCTAQDVGCEAFTVVDEDANGAENSRGYSYLRLCEKPNEDTQTYYTWEGSEASGYQLVTWSMQRDTTAPMPQGPSVIVRAGKDGLLKDPIACNQVSYLTGVDPDCRQFYDPQGNAFYRFESQTVLADAKCTVMRKAGATRADCEKTGGALDSATNICVYQALPTGSTTCGLQVAGCRAYLGTQGGAQTTVLDEKFTTVDYAVNAGSGISGLSLSEESVLVGDRSLRIGMNGGATGEVNFDVPTEPGMLYEVSFWAKGIQRQPYTVTIETSDPSQASAARTAIGTASVGQQWNVYRIGPFTGSANQSATSTRIHLSGFSGTTAFLDTVYVTQVTDVAYVVRDSWQTPDICERTVAGVPQAQAMLGCQDYIDRKKNVVHARQFTNLCRESSIGCTAFIDTKNSASAYEERWQKTAKEAPASGIQLPVGRCVPNNFEYASVAIQNQVEAALVSRTCSSVYDCSVQVSGRTYAGSCDTTLTVHPADQFAYYIDEQTSSCKAAQVGCKAFGLPQYDQTRREYDTLLEDNSRDLSKTFDTVYLKDDVTKYSGALCSASELFCEAYKYNASGQSGTEYFRAPSDHACEYKEGVVVARQGSNGVASAVAQNCSLPNADAYVGATYDGWFRVGTDCPCYPELLSRGKSFGILLTGDVGFNGLAGETIASGTNEYNGWAGICPQTQAECTEFRDVNDQSDPLHPLGRPYYVINDERLDKETCDGRVDPGQGCVLFRDMSDSKLTSNSLATFKEYALRGYKPVSPVDCTATPDLQSCRDAKTEVLQNIHDQYMALPAPGGSAASSCFASAGGGRGGDRRAVYVCFTLYGITEHDRTLSTSLLAQYDALIDVPIPNDTNIVIKVKADRSCSQWLACKTGETVYEQSSGQYKSICSQLELCNKAGANQGEGVPFCESYVNRDQSTLDTILKKYQVLTSKVYASRPIGFGSVDYSGFSIADQFQVVDTSLDPVGSELSTDPKVSAKYKKDYRLVTKVPMSAGSGIVRVPQGTEAATLAGQPLRAFACYFPQTGSYGLLTDAKGFVNANRNATLDSGESEYCALSVDQSQPAQLGVAGAALVADNLNVLTIMQRFSQSESPVLDQLLSRSFPNTQCKAAPQADAPYGSEFVVEWDGTVNPPIPKRAALGYGNANFCEYGEECSCVYKKVTYGKAMSKFYEPLSTDVVNAVCVGGPRDGLACVPNSGIQGSQDINITVTASGTTSNAGSGQGNPDQRCGEGGTCTPIADVSLVRGVTGQCLQYDISRPIAGDQSRSECLVWNPNPVLAGPSDQYHWDPKAGFQPPQTSGRYYCTSAVRSPRVQPLNAFASWPTDMPREGLDWVGIMDLVMFYPPGYGPLSIMNNSINAVLSVPDMIANFGKTASCGDGIVCKGGTGPWLNSEGTFAGRIKTLFYSDWFTSDGNCDYGGFLGWKNLVGTGCTGNVGGASLDGVSPASTAAGKACENIDQHQGPQVNENAMRLVTTGQGTGRSYTEYAILFNPWQIAYGTLGFPASDWETAFEYSLEDVIANFTFAPPKEKIECAYSNSWSGVGGETDEDSWKDTDKAWHAAFSKYLAQGGGTLNRSRSQIVTEDGSPTGIPVKVDCVIQGSADTSSSNVVPDNRADENGLCFLKTWELNYRAEGQQKFQAFYPDIARNGLDHLSRRPVYGKCDSANPWFSIRAVFEDTNHNENAKDPVNVNTDQLVGPFQFVGLWVTACNPGDQTQYIYMTMKMNSADVCRELAETVSKDSHDSAAYTDRNWSQSGYSLSNGFSWDTTNMPFGASLATGDASKQPLFMTGVKQVDVNPMNPPTFTSPGQTYFSSGQYPSSNWGMLSNVFAKIYRVYGYDSRSVSRDDWACTDIRSPNFGQWCPPLTGLNDPTGWVNSEHGNATYAQTISQQYCGVQGRCIAGGIDGTQMFSRKVCNSFSGINRGLDCSSDPDICHIAPMQMSEEGSLVPQYGSCALFVSGYTDPTDATRNVNARWTTINTGGVTRYRCEGTNCPPVSEGCTYDPAATNPVNQTGCNRSVAIKNGAFRCSGSVRDPGMVKEQISGHVTYASFCTKESTNSSECPERIASGTCNGESGTTPGTCEGYPWAQCLKDSDCTFSARNYYPSGSVNTAFNWAYRQVESAGFHSSKLNQSDNSSGSNYLAPGLASFYAFDLGGNAGDDQSASWFTALQNVDGANVQVHSDVFKEAFWPAVPFGLDMGGGTFVNNCSEEGSCFYSTRVSSTADTITYDGWDDSHMMRLSPGFVPFIWWDYWNTDSQMNAISPTMNGSANEYNMGAIPFDMQRVVSTGTTDANNALLDTAPYIRAVRSASFTSASSSAWVNYAACESQALMFKLGQSSNRAPIGTCRGGGRDGVACAADTDCVAPQYRSNLTTLQSDARNWCRPVTTGPNSTNPSNSYRRPMYDSSGALVPATGSQTGFSDACWTVGGTVTDDTADARHPQKEEDPSLDNNRCTRPAGYWPKPQYCLNPDDEYCGLFGYNLSDRSNSVSDVRPLPTDVTAGLYTPRYLNAGGTNVSRDTNSYNYVDYYNPIPPHIAAPDVRTCQGQQCRVTQLDTFSIDGLAEGVVNAGIGNHVATIRFYGWASHEQMPLRRVYVDWGDGMVSELPDAYLKNRKPYCGGTKECSEMSGLTCQTNADCPPGGGLCVTMGTCSNKPKQHCFTDKQCGTEGGFCESRVSFGNDQDACEEQYFEFRHAYSCLGSSIPTESCDTSAGHCSRNPLATCTASDLSRCAEGDSCVQNMSSSLTGCFDNERGVCRFTPRIKLIDNWGWCTGECRSTINQQTRKLEDASSAQVLHPNGGCFDASGIKDNVNFTTAIGPNECADTSSSDRPWIIYPGSVQLRRLSN